METEEKKEEEKKQENPEENILNDMITQIQSVGGGSFGKIQNSEEFKSIFGDDSKGKAEC